MLESDNTRTVIATNHIINQVSACGNFMVSLCQQDESASNLPKFVATAEPIISLICELMKEFGYS